MAGTKAIRLVGLLVMALGGSVPAWAQSALGALAGTAERQLKAGWEGREQNGWFVLRNASAAEDAEQTLTVKAQPLPAEGRLTTVTVSLKSSNPKASIGLLLRGGSSGDMCLMDVTAEAKANLFCIIGGNFQSIASVPGAARLDGSDEIGMIEFPGSANFFVNGKQIGVVKEGSVFGGAVGVMA